MFIRYGNIYPSTRHRKINLTSRALPLVSLINLLCGVGVLPIGNQRGYISLHLILRSYKLYLALHIQLGFSIGLPACALGIVHRICLVTTTATARGAHF